MPSKLTRSDANVLEKIKDPESATSPVLIDDTLPKDPNVTDPNILAHIVKEESAIMKKVIALEEKQRCHDNEIQPGNSTDSVLANKQFRKYMLAKWLGILHELNVLITDYPNYASARNNRAQVLRVAYGDEMFVKTWAETEVKVWPKEQLLRPNEELKQGDPKTVIMTHQLSENFAAENTSVEDLTSGVEKVTFNILEGDSDFERERKAHKSLDEYAGTQADSTLEQASLKVLSDISSGIVLLSPKTPYGAVSPQQATNLARLYMQRAILYQGAAKKLSKNKTIKEEMSLPNGAKVQNATLRAEFRIKKGVPEAEWDVSKFENATSDAFMMAARYGDKLGRQMAVWTNPTAKLCGEIVKEAMRKEYDVGDGEVVKCFNGIGWGFDQQH